MTTVFMSIIFAMALFYAGYSYIDSNYAQANITDGLGYNQSYADINESQTDLSTNINEIQTAGQEIAEADANVLLIAWNGLKGLAATIALFFGVIVIGLNVFDAIFPALFFLPIWVKVLAQMAIVITIILLIIGAFKGESKT